MTQTKLCTHCKEEKLFEAFHKNKSGKFGLQSWCKACSNSSRVKRDTESPESRKKRLQYYKDYHKKRAQNDPEYRESRKQDVRDYQKRRRNKYKQIIFEAKNVPCVDCGVKYPPHIMDLDHVRGEKLFNCSGGMRKTSYRSYDQLREEIAKCEPRCPNCHRMRHYREDLKSGRIQEYTGPESLGLG